MTYQNAMPRIASAHKEKKKTAKSLLDKKIGLTNSSERKVTKMNNFVK